MNRQRLLPLCLLVSLAMGLVIKDVTSRFDWYYEGEAKGDEFGYSVGTAGDVNGDGWDDVIIGAPKDTDTVSREGVAYVFYGSPAGLSATPDWMSGSGESGAEFGAAVNTAGDVNGDGWDDIIVGAHLYGRPETGRVYVFYGSDGGLSATADWTFAIGRANAEFGVSVGTAGDVNGDGWDDIIVGAQGYSDGQSQEGAAFVFYGSQSGPITSTYWMAESGQISALFGASVGTAGDVNGDNYSDVIVGAPQYDNGETDEGAAFVFYGSAGGLSTSYTLVDVDQAEAEFGTSVGAAGDVNGDSWGDVIVGAPHYSGGGVVGGAAFVFHGAGSGLRITRAWTADSDQANALFGISVSTAGDVNEDGYADIIVGAPRHEYDQAEEGFAFVFHGSGAGLNTAASWTAEGDKAETWLGYAVGTAGDVNGDGYADVIVGAPQYRLATEIRGRAFSYYGPITRSDSYVYLPLVMRAPSSLVSSR